MTDQPPSLAHNPLFAGVAPADLAALEAFMAQQTFQPDETLFRQGDRGDVLYAIVAGRVRIDIHDPAGRAIPLRFYTAGDIFGEFSLLDDKPRSASAVAVEPLTVQALNRADFMQFVHDRPLVGLTMLRSLAERIRYTTHYLEQVLEWADLLAAGQYDAVLAQIAAAETPELRAMTTPFAQMVRELQQRHNPTNPG